MGGKSGGASSGQQVVRAEPSDLFRGPIQNILGASGGAYYTTQPRTPLEEQAYNQSRVFTQQQANQWLPQINQLFATATQPQGYSRGIQGLMGNAQGYNNFMASLGGPFNSGLQPGINYAQGLQSALGGANAYANALQTSMGPSERYAMALHSAMGPSQKYAMALQSALGGAQNYAQHLTGGFGEAFQAARNAGAGSVTNPDALYEQARRIGLNPFLQESISAAQRPVEEATRRVLGEQLGTAGGIGAGGGARDQLLRAQTIGELGLQTGDISSRMSSDAYNRAVQSAETLEGLRQAATQFSAAQLGNLSGQRAQFRLGKGGLLAQIGEAQNQFGLGKGNLLANIGGLENQFGLGKGNLLANIGQAKDQFGLGKGNLLSNIGQAENQFGIAKGGLLNQVLGERAQFRLGKRGQDIQGMLGALGGQQNAYQGALQGINARAGQRMNAAQLTAPMAQLSSAIGMAPIDIMRNLGLENREILQNMRADPYMGLQRQAGLINQFMGGTGTQTTSARGPSRGIGGKLGGAATGALGGAAMGTAVPVIGPGIGALLGALGGFF